MPAGRRVARRRRGQDRAADGAHARVGEAGRRAGHRLSRIVARRRPAVRRRRGRPLPGAPGSAGSKHLRRLRPAARLRRGQRHDPDCTEPDRSHPCRTDRGAVAGAAARPSPRRDPRDPWVRLHGRDRDQPHRFDLATPAGASRDPGPPRRPGERRAARSPDPGSSRSRRHRRNARRDHPREPATPAAFRRGAPA